MSSQTAPISIQIIGKMETGKHGEFYNIQVLDKSTGRPMPNVIQVEFPVMNNLNTLIQPEVKLTLLVDAIDLDLSISEILQKSCTGPVSPDMSPDQCSQVGPLNSDGGTSAESQ